MKQDLDSASNSVPEKVLPKKTEKNLYEPYQTPTLIYNILRNLVIVVLSLLSRIHLRGRHNLPRQGPYIIASNHLSWTDIPLVAMYVPSKVVYMAKEELFLGRIGWLIRFLGAFPVKRGKGDRNALRAADEQLKKGRVLVIFPEGTRSKSYTLTKGHTGLGMIALRAGVPVIPVAVWGSEDVFRKFRPEVTIHYGEPVMVKPKGTKITGEDIEQASDEVMRHIAAMLPPRYRGAYAEAE